MKKNKKDYKLKKIMCLCCYPSAPFSLRGRRKDGIKQESGNLMLRRENQTMTF